MTSPIDTASDILGELPPARPDEPAALRRDIADELADHLACAVRREQVRGADYTLAYRRANERLGDIRNLARRLWWLAMKERIMTQRWMVAGQWSLVAAVVVTLAFFGYSQAAMQKTLADQAAVQRHLISQSQQLLLTTGEATRERPLALRDPVLTVLMHLNRTTTEPAPPMRGHVEVKGQGISNQSIMGSAQADDTGLVDCGPLPPGPYQVWVTCQAPDEKGRVEWFSERTVKLDAGRDLFENVPLFGGEMPVPLDVDLTLPKTLREWMVREGLSLVVGFKPLPRLVNDWKWNSRDYPTYVMHPDGTTETRWMFPLPDDEQMFRGVEGMSRGDSAPKSGYDWRKQLFDRSADHAASDSPLLSTQGYCLEWVAAGDAEGLRWLLARKHPVRGPGNWTTPSPDPNAIPPLNVFWMRDRPEQITTSLPIDVMDRASDLFRRTWKASSGETWDLTSLGTLSEEFVAKTPRVESSATTTPSTESSAPQAPAE